MKSYFEQDGVALYHAACVDLLATMPPRSVGFVLTDPPYCARVHQNMRSNKGRRGYSVKDARNRQGGTEKVAGKILQSVNPIDFPSFSDEESEAAFAAMGHVARRWVVATVASEHASALALSPPEGLKAVRTGAWVKIGPTPQMTGDRPAQWWEAVAILHASDGERMRWNGGGRAAVWTFQAEMRGEYPTQKPERLINALLADFAEPADDVLDPFCGSGTTLLCAWRRGHRAVGCDVREQALEIAARRLEREMRQGRVLIPRMPGLADQGVLA